MIDKNCLYTEQHEWVNIEGNIATMGISDHAQELLGELTFVELPEVDDSFETGDSFGVVESVKAASDLYMPVPGRILQINENLTDAPETVNADPFGAAWMIRIQLGDTSSLDSLLEPTAYGGIVG